jgi:NADH:ubiquinone oxidoreductase subunit 5 (subunit L)/multisubunit Na+/H+ antiporter MnhA subunit
LGVLLLIAVGIIIAAFFDKKRDRWSFLAYGLYLILIAILAIVGIELLEALYRSEEFLGKLNEVELTQLNEFVQVITALKWAFTLIAGGIGVNITSHAIINSQAQPLDSLAHEKLEIINSKLSLSNSLIIIAIVLIVIGFVVLWFKV